MRKIINYFSYIIYGIIVGLIVILSTSYFDFLPKKYGNLGVWTQAGIYSIGYAIMFFSILKQKEEWFFYNEYPFKNRLIKFKFFKRKNEEFIKRKEDALLKKQNKMKQQQKR